MLKEKWVQIHMVLKTEVHMLNMREDFSQPMLLAYSTGEPHGGKRGEEVKVYCQTMVVVLFR
jgi:hypothetical protein